MGTPPSAGPGTSCRPGCPGPPASTAARGERQAGGEGAAGDTSRGATSASTRTREWGRASNFAGGGSIQPLAGPPPPKRGSMDAPPQNPTETDPQAPEVTRTRNSAKKMKMGFWESARSRKAIICHTFGVGEGGGIGHFQCSKNIWAPSAPDFVIADEWSCQSTPFPKAPAPFYGGSIDTRPPN